jgi:recombination protein RecA
MVRPFDPDKFRKSITKSIKGISSGFNDPDTWVSTGNFTLNYLISGDFDAGIPLGKVTCFAGESGSGKSYVAAGNLVKNAQAQGIFVVLLDSENALDEEWLKAVGVDTSPEKLLRLGVTMVDDVAGVLSTFIEDYEKEYTAVDPQDRPKVLFVVDSLGMLSTPTDVAQFDRADMKGDMGRKAKSLKALVQQTVNRIAQWNIGFVATNHTYKSQNMFDPDDVISGGMGVIFASSIVVAMGKLKLKEDADGNKITQVRGIRSNCKVVKTRFAKPQESVKVYIPFDTGMDPYSGLFDMLLDLEILTKTGNSYIYVSPTDGAEIKKFKKAWNKNDDGCLDRVMKEWDQIKRAAHTTLADKTNVSVETHTLDIDVEVTVED